MNKKKIKENIKKFWEKYEAKIVLILGLILIAGLSFQAGILKSRKINTDPIVIEKPIHSETKNVEVATSFVENNTSTTTANPQKCAYVGSKNSNLYHLPDSSHAKRIKQENIVCFSSVEDAQTKGYQPSKALSK